MPAKTPLKVVLYWHMHQPEYRDLRDGNYNLPWTYLHAIKDYVDMAAHLEATPGARAVVNFAPILLEQIDDYQQRIEHYLNNSGSLHDPMLSALVEPSPGCGDQWHVQLIKNCLRANRTHMIKRFPAYKQLAEMADWFLKKSEALSYISEQYVSDLLVWYHLAWMGETVRRTDERIKRLIAKERGYTLHERRELLAIIGELVGSVIPRYRALAEQGRIELSMTPYAHPIMPLLLDIQSAKEAMPDAHMPLLEQYPGGEQRTRWHLDKGIATFRKYFGFHPQGCWPSEGSVSDATIRLLSEYGFQWAASGGSVLHNSLAGATQKSRCLHTGYRLQGAGTACFFRDDGLSDLLGFTYSDWHADDAVANLVQHLENIAHACQDHPAPLVPIILDGENAWEYYPENGYYFLSALYQKLSSHPELQLTTFSEYLSDSPSITELPHIVAGSWVYGTFSTWIGDKDKNRGWDILGDAKRCFDRVVASGRLDNEHLAHAEQQLAICEGSDWFWWLGDYNPAESVSSFERQFRLNISNLYQLLGEEPPEELSHTLSHGSGKPAAGGVMRQGQEQK